MDQGVRWSRNFNWPAGVLPGEMAYVVVEGLPSSASVSLSGTTLTTAQEGRFDVTTLLVAANKLVIEDPEDAYSGATEPAFEVRLEIVDVPSGD